MLREWKFYAPNINVFFARGAFNSNFGFHRCSRWPWGNVQAQQTPVDDLTYDGGKRYTQRKCSSPQWHESAQFWKWLGRSPMWLRNHPEAKNLSPVRTRVVTGVPWFRLDGCSKAECSRSTSWKIDRVSRLYVPIISKSFRPSRGFVRSRNTRWLLTVLQFRSPTNRPFIIVNLC